MNDEVFEDAYRVMMPDLDEVFYAKVRARAEKMAAAGVKAEDDGDAVPYPEFDEALYAGVRRRAEKLKANGLHPTFLIDDDEAAPASEAIEPAAPRITVPPASGGHIAELAESLRVLEGSMPKLAMFVVVDDTDIDAGRILRCSKTFNDAQERWAETLSRYTLMMNGISAWGPVPDVVPAVAVDRSVGRMRTKAAAVIDAIKTALPRRRALHDSFSEVRAAMLTEVFQVQVLRQSIAIHNALEVLHHQVEGMRVDVDLVASLCAKCDIAPLASDWYTPGVDSVFDHLLRARELVEPPPMAIVAYHPRELDRALELLGLSSGARLGLGVVAADPTDKEPGLQERDYYSADSIQSLLMMRGAVIDLAGGLTTPGDSAAETDSSEAVPDPDGLGACGGAASPAK